MLENKISLYKLSIVYLFAFVLLYVEAISISGITISIIWKIILMSYILIIVSFKLSQIKKIDAFIFFYILLSLKVVFLN